MEVDARGAAERNGVVEPAGLGGDAVYAPTTGVHTATITDVISSSSLRRSLIASAFGPAEMTF